MILSLAILNLNRHLFQNDMALAQNRYKLEALSMLNSYLEQATEFYFDEASTDTVNEKKLTNFTLPGNLGFEANDNNVIDDFDDYNNYTVIDTGRSGVAYHLDFKVDYVKIQNGQVVTSSNRQYAKRITISITDNYTDPLLFHYVGNQKVKDTLRVEYVHGYWFYN